MPLPNGPARQEALAALKGAEAFDLLVVGGGVVGAAAAWEAARWGQKVLLVEAEDFAHGSSSRSSKLLHGGVRYLEQGQVGLVFESISQRDRLMDDAPHVAWDLPFLFPIPSGKPWRRPYIGLGLAVYDALAWAARHGVGALRTWLGAKELAEREPGLNVGKLGGAYRYHDGGTDDARLVLEALREASDAGATCLNHLRVASFLRDAKGQVVGASLLDGLSGQSHEVKAKLTLLACGPSTDAVLRLLDPKAKPRLRPTKGVHLVVAQALVEHAVVIDSQGPGEKKPRVMFAIPWLGRTLVGTTDTDVAKGEDPVDTPAQDLEATAEEVAYVLAAANAAFKAQLGPQDVIAAFAGWRPLMAPASEDQGAGAISREHQMWSPAPGLWAMAGGKLTSFRSMGAEAIEQLLVPLGLVGEHSKRRKGPTIEEAHMGGLAWMGPNWASHLAAAPKAMPELPPALATHLARRHGGRWAEVAHWARLPGHGEAYAGLEAPFRLCPGEVRHFMEAEAACEVADVLLRRTRLAWLQADHGLGLAPQVAKTMAQHRVDAWGEAPEAAEAWAQASLKAFEAGVARMLAFRAAPIASGT